MTRRYADFPDGFFSRADESDDGHFYQPTRMVTHIDDHAIAAVGEEYRRLGLSGRILDLMGSWISHFPEPPTALTVLGRNREELAANRQAIGGVVADLNRHQALPFPDASFDGATCCVSVDYLTRPLEVFDEVARVLVPGGIFCVTFSNRCFPTKVIQGWAQTDDRFHIGLVMEYFQRSGPWGEPQVSGSGPPDRPGDPLFAVSASRA
ncbi:MAG: class I SAM-dependent methyltransferase [Actinomycetota bacterium]